MKQLYSKPELSRVELVASEALSRGCKNANYGPASLIASQVVGYDCEPGGPFDECHLEGS